MANAYDYNEQNISQKPAMEVLNNLGYEIIAPKDAEAMRGNLYNVLLKPILKKQLEKLNSFEYKGEDLKFSNKSIEQAIVDLIRRLFLTALKGRLQSNSLTGIISTTMFFMLLRSSLLKGKMRKTTQDPTLFCLSMESLLQ